MHLSLNIKNITNILPMVYDYSEKSAFQNFRIEQNITNIPPQREGKNDKLRISLEGDWIMMYKDIEKGMYVVITKNSKYTKKYFGYPIEMKDLEGRVGKVENVYKNSAGQNEVRLMAWAYHNTQLRKAKKGEIVFFKLGELK